MKKVLIYILCVVLMTASLMGCAQKDGTLSAGAEDRISIVSTIFPPYDFARAVAGDKADVNLLVDPGTEVHSYDPSPADIVMIQDADIFIYIGGENDAWVNTVLSSMDLSDMTIIRMMDVVKPVEEEAVAGMQQEENEDVSAEEEREYDEHIWTSPKNAVLMVKAIQDALCAIDADNAQAYEENATAYTAEIEELDTQLKQIVNNASSHTLVVGDRFPFRYMAEEYGLEYRAAFLGCSAQTEVSANTLAYLIDYVQDNNIEYVYYIEFSNKNIASSICEQTGAQMLLLHSCHNVTSEEFETGVTYISLMKNNAENLKKGLG